MHAPHAVLMIFPDHYKKRHRNLAAHISPAFHTEVGDIVTVSEFGVALVAEDSTELALIIGQCRPLSKTVRLNAVRVLKKKAAARAFGKF